MVRDARDYSGGAFDYRTTARSKYDGKGQVVESWDANGNHSSTSYTANAVGLVTGATKTNPLGHVATSTILPTRGVTLSMTDANHNTTRTQFDALGRATATWLANRPTTSPANYQFAYDVSDSGPVAVTTKTMNDSQGYITSVVIYDALLRIRQTQTMSPQSGRLVTDNFYDSRGWVTTKYGSWWDPAALPSNVVASAADLHAQVPFQAFETYDGLGRNVREATAKDGVEVAATTTVYQGDRTTVVPPTGGTVTSTAVDPLGRNIALERIQDTADRRRADRPVHRHVHHRRRNQDHYYLRLRRARQTVRRHVHRRQGLVDHERPAGPAPLPARSGRGDSEQRFDDSGNMIEQIDSRLKAVSYTYDGLNRKTNEYAAKVDDQSTANRTASWVYDNANNAIANMTNPIGQLTTSTAYVGTAQYTVQARGFNVFGKSSGETITIPAVEGALGGTYQYIHQYSTNTGLKLKDVYQQKANLPAETVAYGYLGVFDLWDTVGGLRSYSDGTTYDAYGRISEEVLGAQPNTAKVTNIWDDHTTRLVTRVVAKSGGGTPSALDRQDYEYDLAGNILKQSSTRLAAPQPSEVQCFHYDGLDRLANAWTATDNCATTPNPGNRGMVGSSLGGAYWTSWTVDDLGNRTKEIRYGATSTADATTDYAYNGNGANQPDTLTSTATSGATTASTSYAYDSAGNMTSRNAGDGMQSLTWNNQGRLSTVTGSAAGDSSFVHDASGNLLVERNPANTTLYLPDQQLVLDRASGTVTDTRYYTLPGGERAVRNGVAADAVVFKLTDQRGTPSLYLDDTAQIPTWRLSTPYGEPRGSSGSWVDNRGFLDKPVNPATGLSELGARNYDAKAGRFISPDPVIDLAHPQSYNGYSYANNNPVTTADPTGLNAYDSQTPCARYNCGSANVDNSETATENATNNEKNGWISPRKRQTLNDVLKATCGMMTSCVKRNPPKAKNDPRRVAYLDISRRPDCGEESDVPCWVALEILLRGGDPASAYEVLNNPCDYLYCSTPTDMLLGGHVIEYPWPHAWLSDMVLNGIAAGVRPRGGGRGAGLRGVGEEPFNNFPGGKGGRLTRSLCDSFTSDTQVLLANGGAVPISELKSGDVVLATDPDTGTGAPKPVVAVLRHLDASMTDVRVVARDGTAQTVRTTPWHLFWSDSKQDWVPAGQLVAGDILRTMAAGGVARVLAVSTYPATRTMLNLTVDDFHTYYVLAGNSPVLVHNQGELGPGQIYLYRAVKGPELAEIHSTRSFRSPDGGTKYFSYTEGGAAEYARRAYAAFPNEGPYTIVRIVVNVADIPAGSIMPRTADVIDVGVALPAESLPKLGRPRIMTGMSTGIACPAG